VIQVLEDFQFDGIAPHDAQCTTSHARFAETKHSASDQKAFFLPASKAHRM
jgi:hypothetical protein